MRFDIITIFPEAFDSYLNASLMARAQAKSFLEVNVWNLRDWAADAHKTVDDRPYGGGAGMVMRVDVFERVLKNVAPRKNKQTRIINLTASGKTLTQAKVEELAEYKRLVLLCGRYEGIDARVKHLVDEEISIGDYVLTGGELPALVILDAVARFVPGVVGKEESVRDESFSKPHGLLEYPQYTRPEIWPFRGKNYRVPKVLLSGNHREIENWRRDQAYKITKKIRPDLFGLKFKKQNAK